MTNTRRKLIFLWTYLEWGGAQIYFMAIMKEARENWDILVVLPRNSSPEMIRFLDQIGVEYDLVDFHIDSVPAPTIMRKIQRQWNRIHSEFATFRYLKRFDLSQNTLHIETCPWQSWQFLTLLSLRKANVFVTMHNAINTKSRWRELVWKVRMQFVSRLPGFHIFVSNEDTKTKIRHLVEAGFWEKIPVIYTCVDRLQIKAVLGKAGTVAEIRSRHGFAANDFIVLCVGQFIDRKGRWIFLDAANFVQKEAPEIKFVWLTPVAPNDDEKRRIAEYGLNNFNLMLSSTVGSKREEVLEFFRIADVFTLPSYVEGLPIALLEAMALGIPSISTRVYAIPEAVHHAQTGILIEPGDAEALANAILELRDSPDLRKKLAQIGSEYVLANFDERVSAQKAISAYEECFRDGH